MRPVFSTNEVTAEKRFDYWHDVACNNIVLHDCQADDPGLFNAQIEAASIGDVDLVRFQNSPMSVEQTSRQIVRACSDDLFFCRQLAGKLGLEQSGREVALEPGETTLLNPMLRYKAKFFSGSRLLVFKIPRAELEARLGKTNGMVALPFMRKRAEARMASSILGALPSYAGELSPTAEHIARNQILDLVAVSLSSVGDLAPNLSSPRKLVLLSLHAAMEARLADPNLDAKQVAAAAGVGVRYANAILAENDTSIMRLIQSKRLERCRAALEDPLQSRRTLREIAYACGFSDMTHFGRRFRKAYGMLPNLYRRVHEGPK